MSEKKELNEKRLEDVQGGVDEQELPSDESKKQEQEERNLINTIIDSYEKMLEGKYK